MTAVITRAESTGDDRATADHPVAITALRPTDGPELVALHERCSPETRFRRWHGHARDFPRSYLAALIAADGDQLGVVARRDGRLVGFASAARTAPSSREIGILVEDAYQRRGVGRGLLDALVRRCRQDGTQLLVAEVLAEDSGLLALLRAYGPVDSRLSHGVFRATLVL